MIRALLVAVLLAGCASAHPLRLVPHDGGATGTGTVPRTLVSYNGDLSINLEGETYSGRWTYVPEGGSLTMLTGFGVSGGSVASGVATGASVPMSGGGLANLTAPSGASLRCEFRYSDVSSSGLGLCKRSTDGKMYDLHIG